MDKYLAGFWFRRGEICIFKDFRSAVLAEKGGFHGEQFYYVISCTLFDPQFTARNHQSLYLACALVNLRDLCIAKVTFHRQFFAVSHAAMNLYGLMCNIHGCLGCKQLCHGCLK